MYNTDIQTTISIRGMIIFIEYKVTEEWAVCWWLNLGAYVDKDITEEQISALDALDTLLRVNEAAVIEEKLLSEFEDRQYQEEQKTTALEALEDYDIPF